MTYLQSTNLDAMISDVQVFDYVLVSEVPVAVANLVEVDRAVGLRWGLPGEQNRAGIVRTAGQNLSWPRSGNVAQRSVDDEVRELALASSRHDGNSDLEKLVR